MIEKMTTPQQPASAASLRGLGWDIDSPFSTNRGALLPVGSLGIRDSPAHRSGSIL